MGNNIFIVEVTDGDIEVGNVTLHFISFDNELAKKKCADLIQSMQDLRAVPCPYIDEQGFPRPWQELTEEEYGVFQKWQEQQLLASRFLGACVVEYELNKIYDTWRS